MASDLRDTFRGMVAERAYSLSPDIVGLLPIIVSGIIRKLAYPNLVHLTDISSRAVPGKRSTRSRSTQENPGHESIQDSAPDRK
jgi:hypothetical protein